MVEFTLTTTCTIRQLQISYFLGTDRSQKSFAIMPVPTKQSTTVVWYKILSITPPFKKTGRPSSH